MAFSVSAKIGSPIEVQSSTTTRPSALGHHWCNCGDEGCFCLAELLEFHGRAKKDSEH